MAGMPSCSGASPGTTRPSAQRVVRHTTTPWACACRSAASTSWCKVPLPVPATTSPRNGATPGPAYASKARTSTPSAPAWLTIVSTRGQPSAASRRGSSSSCWCCGLGQGLPLNPATSAAAGQARHNVRRPCSTCPSGPASPELKASSRYGWIFCTASARWARPAHTTTTPRAPGWAATSSASARFCGPSGASAVAGRMAHVSTTGLAGHSTRCSR